GNRQHQTRAATIEEGQIGNSKKQLHTERRLIKCCRSVKIVHGDRDLANLGEVDSVSRLVHDSRSRSNATKNHWLVAANRRRSTDHRGGAPCPPTGAIERMLVLSVTIVTRQPGKVKQVTARRFARVG